MKRINVFVPIYYRDEVVRQCVPTTIGLALHDSDQVHVSLIFLNNGCTQQTKDWLTFTTENNDAPSNLSLHLVNFPENVGKGVAVNRGVEMYPEFDYFINCDSDVLHYTDGWPIWLMECYEAIDRIGFLAPEFIGTTNNPMPAQPDTTKFKVATPHGTRKYKFHHGAGVAGTCHMTDRGTWDRVGGYIENKYGGIDGTFRARVHYDLKLLSGYTTAVQVEHCDDPEQFPEYWEWKQSIQNQIRRFGPHAKAEVLGFDKDFEFEETDE